jgi:hypothetical protein
MSEKDTTLSGDKLYHLRNQEVQITGYLYCYADNDEEALEKLRKGHCVWVSGEHYSRLDKVRVEDLVEKK